MGNCLQWRKSSSEHHSAPTSASVIMGASTCQTTTNIEGRFGANNANECENDETDELLSPRSPLQNANNCDKKRNSFKKSSLVLLNGNTATMSDIITTVKASLEVSDNTLNLLFEEYKDPDEDNILSDGIERLCRDLNYQPDDFAILVLAWFLDASQMCRFTKTEFIEGMHKMCADTIETIRKRLEQTIEMLREDAEMFKQLYRFTFRFGLEPEQRILSLDMAICLWNLVFTVHSPDLLDNWIHFLEQHPIRGIPKDTWNMFLNFSEQCDINNYDDTEAWPSLFDDFVDFEKSRLSAESAVETNTTTTGPHDDDNNNDDPLQSQQKLTPPRDAL